jgi:hypothetical protein
VSKLAYLTITIQGKHIVSWQIRMWSWMKMITWYWLIFCLCTSLWNGSKGSWTGTILYHCLDTDTKTGPIYEMVHQLMNWCAFSWFSVSPTS